MTSMIRPELPQLVGDEVVVAGADRLVVGHDGVHVEVDEVLHCVRPIAYPTDRSACPLSRSGAPPAETSVRTDALLNPDRSPPYGDS